MEYTREKKQKIKDDICALLDKSFEVDALTEKKHNPAWVIVSYVLQKYIQFTRADIVIPMRVGFILGPWFKWFPDDISISDIKDNE